MLVLGDTDPILGADLLSIKKNCPLCGTLYLELKIELPYDPVVIRSIVQGAKDLARNDQGYDVKIFV